MSTDVSPSAQVQACIPAAEDTRPDTAEQWDKRTQKIKMQKKLLQLFEFYDDSINLDLDLHRDPGNKDKYIQMMDEYQDYGVIAYDMPPEEVESQKRDFREKFEAISYSKADDKLRLEVVRELVTKNAGFNAKKYLGMLKPTEKKYDCTNVAFSQTENVAPEQRIIGKKVRKKFQGQKQMAVEIKSYGLVTKKFTYEDFLDSAKPYIILSGVAGSGKSVILRELALEFYSIKEYYVDGLCKFKLLVHFECSNRHVANYQEMIQFNFTSVCGHLGVETVANVISQLHVLYVVDGYDEVNPVSDLALRDLLKLVQAKGAGNKNTILFSTRPHAVQSLKDFLQSFKIPSDEINTLNVVY